MALLPEGGLSGAGVSTPGHGQGEGPATVRLWEGPERAKRAESRAREGALRLPVHCYWSKG